MATVLCDDLQICMDCALIIANDDDSGIANPDAHRARMAAVRARGPEGHWVLTGGSDMDDTPISTVACASCGTSDAGYRTSAAILG